MGSTTYTSTLVQGFLIMFKGPPVLGLSGKLINQQIFVHIQDLLNQNLPGCGGEGRETKNLYV